MKSLAQKCYDFASIMLGALTLACVGAFVLQCGELSSLRVYSFVHNLILPSIIVGVTGAGCLLGLRLICLEMRPKQLSASLIFSIVFLLLQLFFIVVPSMDSCGCVSLKLAIINYHPGLQMHLAFPLFLGNLIVFWLFFGMSMPHSHFQ